MRRTCSALCLTALAWIAAAGCNSKPPPSNGTGGNEPGAGGAGTAASTGGAGAPVNPPGTSGPGGTGGAGPGVVIPPGGPPIAGVDAGAPPSGPPVAPPATPGTPVALPIVVTDHFTNRGWVADPALDKRFSPEMIKEVAGGGGLCASRPAGAKGTCYQVTYTPPAGFVETPASYVGVHMLPTLKQDNPQTGAKVGQANWGQEPGIPVARGARRLTFYAASEQPVKLEFAGGMQADQITTLPYPLTLTPGWKQYSIDLAGGDTGAALYSGFSWVFFDPGRPITFYIDGIVWDDVGELPPALPAGTKNNARDIQFINNCQETVWVGIFTQRGPRTNPGGFQLDRGQTRRITTAPGWQGRFWGRTKCTFNAQGQGQCLTGNCPGGLDCTDGTRDPVTLGEMSFNSPPDSDFYDISLVDGFNLPMALGPQPGTHGRKPGAAFDCLTPMCAKNLAASCPLRFNADACASACYQRPNDPAACCTGAMNTPETCPGPPEAAAFEQACPHAYSYAYDDRNSTFTCLGEDYAAVFCPEPRK